MNLITVLLADDNRMVLEGFRTILGSEPDIKVIGAAANGNQAIAMARKLLPAVVLLDVVMPLSGGLQAIRPILRAVSSTKILMHSTYSDEAYVEEALKFGAVGYLLKHADPDYLCVAIREAMRGKLVFSPALTKRFKNWSRSQEVGYPRPNAGLD